jgi:hypothetical protein
LILDEKKLDQNKMQILTITLILLVVIIFLTSQMSIADEFTIIQLPVSKIKDDILLEKKPIVISDSIVNAIDVIDTVFSFMYLFKKLDVQVQSNHTLKNKFAYLVIHTKIEQMITVTHPKSDLSALIKLYPGNMLILPWSWKYNIKNKDDVYMIGLHTLMSCIL